MYGNHRVFHKSAIVCKIYKISSEIYYLRIKEKNISKNVIPGQFFHIKIDELPLRRPLSVFDVKREFIDFIFKVRGKGTRILTSLEKGERIDLIGPCGNGFKIFDSRPIFFAGGIGFAPLYFLAKNYERKGIFIYGVRRKKEFVPFEVQGHRFIRVSEEEGKKVTDFLNLVEDDDIIYAAGPRDMLKKIIGFSKRRGVKCFFSWEERMGCGIGLCRCCVIFTKDGNKRVCIDGPVFSKDEVDLKCL
ncbi:MAG: NAD-dependent dihydroorotate dehydrogenase B electron transfer subunit [Caldiserica bacterium]|nr:MAG: NAD-dependent dihydroorotate dehydrogenase B electron transfer subunit [Caldisericota bacterium]